MKCRSTNGIYINRDLTRIQQSKAYATRQKFKGRVNNGEKDIRLKYHNGIPKIVKIKNL